MKTAKKTEELTAIKGGKEIPFVRLENGADTGKLILLVLSYNPSLADPEAHQNWGITTAEMIERRAIRKAVEALPKDAKTITITEAQAKILYDLTSIIKWKGEDDFILDFQESLK